jgi:ATP-dependent protease HslVU (ClpYQ) peptidase subunit
MLKDKKGNLWFAGDRRMSWGMHKAIKAPDPKVRNRGGVLLAGTGDASVCDLVTDYFPIPKFSGDLTIHNHMFNVFIPSLKAWLAENGRLNAEGTALNKGEAVIVIGIKDKLFELVISTETISYVSVEAPYAAGCGGQLALGSLLTTEGNSRLTPKERLKIALKVAAIVSPGCDGNIDIINNII